MLKRGFTLRTKSPFEHPNGGVAVPDSPEGEGGVIPQILEQHVLAPGVGAQELRDVVHLVVDHGPAVLPRVVESHLREADNL